jgi:hypothetical protein
MVTSPSSVVAETEASVPSTTISVSVPDSSSGSPPGDDELERHLVVLVASVGLDTNRRAGLVQGDASTVGIEIRLDPNLAPVPHPHRNLAGEVRERESRVRSSFQECSVAWLLRNGIQLAAVMRSAAWRITANFRCMVSAR